jgi:hypothetical protein
MVNLFFAKFIPIFVITSSFKRKKFSLSFLKKSSDVTYPLISSIFNIIIIFAFFIFLLYFIPSFFEPFNISFVFTYAIIVGISTFYYIGSEPLEILNMEMRLDISKH